MVFLWVFKETCELVCTAKGKKLFIHPLREIRMNWRACKKKKEKEGLSKRGGGKGNEGKEERRLI